MEEIIDAIANANDPNFPKQQNSTVNNQWSKSANTNSINSSASTAETHVNTKSNFAKQRNSTLPSAANYKHSNKVYSAKKSEDVSPLNTMEILTASNVDLPKGFTDLMNADSNRVLATSSDASNLTAQHDQLNQLENKTNNSASDTVNSVTDSIGQQLRLAREAKALTLREVAQQLHLSDSQVLAMENNQWQLLPGHPYLRGFVRNYLKLLKLPEEAILEQLMQLNQTAESLILKNELEEVSEFESSQDVKKNREWLFVILGLLILLLGAAYFLIGGTSTRAIAPSNNLTNQTSKNHIPATESSSAPTAQLPSNTSTVTVNNPTLAAVANPVSPETPALNATVNSANTSSANNTISANDTLMHSTNNVQAVVPSVNSSANSSTVDNVSNEQKGAVTLNLSFAADAWATVIDASGQKILNQLNLANSNQQVSGKPPFRLTVGRASLTTLTYQGKTISLIEHSKGDVARLTLE